MVARKKVIIIAFALVFLLASGILYFLHFFFSAFAPAKISVTENYITTNRNFINGLTVEKIRVDSIGSEKYPVKYTTTYLTTCSIEHPENRPPEPPDKIYFNKEGKYWWTEENINIRFIHDGLSRHSVDQPERIVWSMGNKKSKTCPIKFEKEQWYFITISDPQLIGIFFYIDDKGIEFQHTIESGVSPI